MNPFSQDLVIHRGASFDPVGWVLRDEDGQPLRSTAGLDATAVVKRWRGDPDVLHRLPCSAALHTFDGEYGDLPVALAQIDAMTAAETAALTFDRGVFAVVINGDYRGGGRITAPRVRL